MFDFSHVVDRHGTFCTQWDYVEDRFGYPELLPFTISDMDFETAPCVLKAIKQRVNHGVFGYSRWDHNEFKSAITDWFSLQYHVSLEAKNVVYGPSVIYIISQLIKLWSQPGDGVLIHTPAYDAFHHMLSASQRTMLSSPLLKVKGYYEIDWQQFEEQVAQPHCKILLLCNPQNPTGKVWTSLELRRMANICQGHNVKVISDDIHMDMAFECYTPWPAVAHDDEWALVTSGSKSFNIPALNGAYAFIPNDTTRSVYLQQLKAAHGLSSPSILGVIAHIAAYREGGPWLEALKVYLQDNLNYVAQRLNQAFPELDYHPPQGTYLVWLDLNPLIIDMDILQRQLILHYKVAIMRGDLYGEEGQGYIRLNVGCPRSKVEAGVNALIGAICDVQERSDKPL